MDGQGFGEPAGEAAGRWSGFDFAVWDVRRNELLAEGALGDVDLEALRSVATVVGGEALPQNLKANPQTIFIARQAIGREDLHADVRQGLGREVDWEAAAAYDGETGDLWRAWVEATFAPAD